MSIAQRGTSQVVGADSTDDVLYRLDRFQYNYGSLSTGRYTVSHKILMFHLVKVLQHLSKIDCTTADASLAAYVIYFIDKKLKVKIYNI
jgi:hypothetical protein